MMKILPVILAGTVLAGCASAPPEWLSAEPQCNYIGCTTGGLVSYPNEEFSAQRQPRRWHNWEWGQTSRDMDPSSEEYRAAWKKEAEHSASMGLDPWGRPFDDGY